MTPKEVIELIQEQKRSAGEGNLKTIAGAIDRLQKAFPRYGSFALPPKCGAMMLPLNLARRALPKGVDKVNFHISNEKQCEIDKM